MRRLMFVSLTLSFALVLGCGKNGDDKSKPETMDDVVKDMFKYQEQLAEILDNIESDADFDKNKDRIEKILDSLGEIGPRLKVVFKGKKGKEVMEEMDAIESRYPEANKVMEKLETAERKLPKGTSERFETMKKRASQKINAAMAEFEEFSGKDSTIGAAKSFEEKTGAKSVTPKYEKTK